MIRNTLISFGRASISIVPQHPAGSVSERKPSEINATLVRSSLPGAPLGTSPRGIPTSAYTKRYPLSRTLHFHRSFPLVYRDRLAISYRDHAQVETRSPI